MTNIIPRPSNHNARALPLFEVAERVHVRALPLAARRLVRRFRLPPPTAATIAALAGFKPEGSQ